MKNIIIKEILVDLSDLVVKYNQDLKKADFENILIESNILIDKAVEKIPDLINYVKINPSYGKNIELTSFTGKILFPSILFRNPFRLLIIRELKAKIYDFKSFDEIVLFLYKKLINTIDVKKGGFTKKSLETLRFYLLNFDKIIDDDVNKFLPYLSSYEYKYIPLNKSTLLKRFPLTQKYTSYYILPNFQNFGLNAILFQNNDNIESILDDLECSPFGFLFNDQKINVFSLFFAPYQQNLKSNFIERICIFENLDLFYRDPKHKTYYNKTNNILELYYKYLENDFTDTAISFDRQLFNKKTFNSQVDNLDLFIHLLNSRRFPDDHYVHPVSKHLFTYRNKVVNFYATTGYFIYIYEPNGKIIKTQSDLIVTLLKNTFSNGFIIKSKSAFLVSTLLFKNDFEKQKASFIEFFIYFKLEVQIFENLNYTPFSFYYIPSSTHFNVETNSWQFPLYQEKPIEELMQYQVANLQSERSKLQDAVFKQRVDNFYEIWSKEVASLKNDILDPKN